MIYGRPSPKLKWIQKEDKNIDKSKSVKIFFIILRGFFMLGFGFIRPFSRKRQLFFALLSVIQLTAISILFEFRLFSNFPFQYAFRWNLYIIHYFFNVIILSYCNKRKTLYTLFQNLFLADQDLCLNVKNNVELKMIVCITIAFANNIGLWMLHCNFFPEICNNIENYYYWLYILLFFGPNLPLMIYFFLFYAVYCRLKQLRIAIERSHREIISSHILYKYLIDTTEQTKEIFDYLFLCLLIIKVPEKIFTIVNIIQEFKDATIVITLLFNIPSVMFVMYTIITEIKLSTKLPVGYVAECFSVTSLLIVIFAPSIFASSLLSEAQNIKIILHNMKFETTNENQVKDIDRFIQNVEARPFKFCVLKIFPMDATLPIMIINLGVTYLIVILQLTHTY